MRITVVERLKLQKPGPISLKSISSSSHSSLRSTITAKSTSNFTSNCFEFGSGSPPVDVVDDHVNGGDYTPARTPMVSFTTDVEISQCSTGSELAGSSSSESKPAPISSHLIAGSTAVSDISTQHTPSTSSSGTTLVPTESAKLMTAQESLRLSYIILNEHIADTEAFGLLGRLVANVKCPLQEYTPMHVFPTDREIPGLLPLQSISPTSTNEGFLKKGSSDPVVDSSSGCGSRSSSFKCTQTYTQVDHDTMNNIDPSILLFHNLPLTLSESSSATFLHSTRCTQKSESLLTALFGLSLHTSTDISKAFRLKSKLIKTVSLSHQQLVWSHMIRVCKKEIMSAVRKCGGKMYLVIGVKIARDAEVERGVSGEKVVGGKIELDVGIGTGVKGFGAGSIGGKSPIRAFNRTEKLKEAEEWRSERIMGDRAFAIEYREVKLKMKLDMRRKKQTEETAPKANKHQEEVRNFSSHMPDEHMQKQIQLNNALQIQLQKQAERLDEQAQQLKQLSVQQAILAQAVRVEPGPPPPPPPATSTSTPPLPPPWDQCQACLPDIYTDLPSGDQFLSRVHRRRRCAAGPIPAGARDHKLHCLQCRARRFRGCDKTRPSCGECVKSNLPCLYLRSSPPGAREDRLMKEYGGDCHDVVEDDDNDNDEDYELELGDEVYVQELDAVC